MVCFTSTRNHLDCSGLVHLLAILVRKVYIDGDCANYLPLKEVHEMIWSHPSFTKVMLATYDTNEAILKAKGVCVCVCVDMF